MSKAIFRSRSEDSHIDGSLIHKLTVDGVDVDCLIVNGEDDEAVAVATKDYLKNGWLDECSKVKPKQKARTVGK